MRAVSRSAAVALVAGWALAWAPAAGEARVADTAHNLSATGQGSIRAAGVTEVCVFCHVPHRSAQTRALWNRDLPPTTYKIYTSPTLEASVGQPSGASRLCLSCHDGTLAMSALRVRPRTGALGALPALTGRSSLGTDLSDDHPVSFVYDPKLATTRGELANPITLATKIRLDQTRQVQCTSCHDPHENPTRKFLRVDDRNGALCITCHKLKNWSNSVHAISGATWSGRGASPWLDSPYRSVADNACESCHRAHAAPRGVRLLSSAQERMVCLVCHNGNVAGKNLEAEFSKPSTHPVVASEWVHEPREDPAAMTRHVTCVDCHNPHQTASGATGSFRGVRGLNVSGSPVSEARQEYEVCLKCHGIRDQPTPGPVRQDPGRNVRLKINPGNQSHHPVAAPARQRLTTPLQAGYTPGTLITCTDCHNNDEWTAGSSKPRGPHGSRNVSLLERPYDMNDPVTESPGAYALCYKCHSREALLVDRPGAFPHARHVVVARASCTVCHDAHGSREAPFLVNFLLRDRTGKTVVSPSLTQRRLEYVPGGAVQGSQCYLSCHGTNHEPSGSP